MAQLGSLVDGLLREQSFIELDQLLASDDLRRGQDLGLQLDGLHLHLKFPVLHSILIEKLFNAILDTFHTFSGRSLSLLQSVPHLGPLSNRLRHSIKIAELRRQVYFLLASLSLEQRLVMLSHNLIVLLFEVLTNVHQFALPCGEGLSARVAVEHHVNDDVLATVTPLGDDRFVHELSAAHLLPDVDLATCLGLELVHLLEACLGRHKFKARVDYQGAAHLALDR